MSEAIAAVTVPKWGMAMEEGISFSEARERAAAL